MDLLVVAGEASGDLRAAEVVEELLKTAPDLDVAAYGGPALEQAGARLLYDLTHLALIGLTGVIRQLGTIRRLLREITSVLRRERPRAVMLVDFPGFNRRVAAKAKRLGIPVVYFISPQVWAWLPGRAEKIARVVDKMLVLFKFEKRIYEQYGVDTVWVGHPMVDTVKAERPLEEVRVKHGLGNARLVALLPGSRRGEIEQILPVLLKTAGRLQAELPDLRFCLPLAPTLDPADVEGFLARSPVEVIVVKEDGYALRQLADLSLVASGTATLEGALLGSPMVIVYRVGWMNYLLARMLIRVRNIGMVNIVAGEVIVPEFVQGGARPELIAREAADLLRNDDGRAGMRAKLEQVAVVLGAPGASMRAAGEVAAMLGAGGK